MLPQRVCGCYIDIFVASVVLNGWRFDVLDRFANFCTHRLFLLQLLLEPRLLCRIPYVYFDADELAHYPWCGCSMVCSIVELLCVDCRMCCTVAPSELGSTSRTTDANHVLQQAMPGCAWMWVLHLVHHFARRTGFDFRRNHPLPSLHGHTRLPL